MALGTRVWVPCPSSPSLADFCLCVQPFLKTTDPSHGHPFSPSFTNGSESAGELTSSEHVRPDCVTTMFWSHTRSFPFQQSLLLPLVDTQSPEELEGWASQSSQRSSFLIYPHVERTQTPGPVSRRCARKIALVRGSKGGLGWGRMSLVFCSS